uniref:Uncharacterized protein n=1 Tax=Anguilla anguilla TaxID=7936 RepID=A0A0E9WUN3_ANGAN
MLFYFLGKSYFLFFMLNEKVTSDDKKTQLLFAQRALTQLYVSLPLARAIYGIESCAVCLLSFSPHDSSVFKRHCTLSALFSKKKNTKQ